MTDQNYAHISIIVDRSGSMAAIRGDAEGGLREYVNEQRAQGGALTISFYQFDDDFDEVAAMSTGDPLAGWSLRPRGMTALLDAMGKAIVKTGEDLAALPEDKRPGRVLVVVVTDGQENASHDWTREMVFDLITQQRETYSWEVIFTAANQDAVAVGESLGVAHSMNFDATGAGTRSAYSVLSGASGIYRSSGLVQLPEDAPTP